MITGILLMTTTLFNTQQNTITLFTKDPVTPGTYKVRAHANTIIEKAETEYGTCNISGQDAVCSVNIPKGTSGNLFLSTLRLQKRADNHYIVDFSNTDPALKPTPTVYNSDILTGGNKVKINTTKANDTNLTNKKTGLSLTLLLALLLVIATSYKLINIRKN